MSAVSRSFYWASLIGRLIWEEYLCHLSTLSPSPKSLGKNGNQSFCRCPGLARSPASPRSLHVRIGLEAAVSALQSAQQRPLHGVVAACVLKVEGMERGE